MICVVWWHVVVFLAGWLLIAIGGHVLGFTYWLNNWYALDCGCNSVRGGDPRETMSSAFGKAVRRGNPVAKFVCKVLHRMDEDHCEDAIAEQLGDRGVPVGMLVVGLFFMVFSVLLYVVAV